MISWGYINKMLEKGYITFGENNTYIVASNVPLEIKKELLELNDELKEYSGVSKDTFII